MGEVIVNLRMLSFNWCEEPLMHKGKRYHYHLIFSLSSNLTLIRLSLGALVFESVKPAPALTLNVLPVAVELHCSANKLARMDGPASKSGMSLVNVPISFRCLTLTCLISRSLLRGESEARPCSDSRAESPCSVDGGDPLPF